MIPIYNKKNVIIREIWSIKLELQNFFEEFRFFLSNELLFATQSQRTVLVNSENQKYL